MQFKVHADYQANIILRLLFNSLSLLGSLFIIFSYLKFPKLRKFAFKLIFYLSVSDLIFSIATFLITNNAKEINDHFCQLQGFLLYYSSISTIFWTSCIAFSLQKVVTCNNRDIEKKERYFCFVGFILPAVFAIIPLILDGYGPSSFLTDTDMRWCGIARIIDENGEIEAKGIVLDWVFRFVPIMICFFFNMYMYLKVRRFFQNLESTTDLLDIIKTKIKYFPLIPIFCWSIEMILRILEIIYINDNKGIFDYQYVVWLDYFDSILEKSHGLCNALLYGCTHYVIKEWRNYARKKTGVNDEMNESLNSSVKGNSNIF